MQFCAKAKYIRFSPYKLRPLAKIIRGRNVASSLQWLETHKVKLVVPLKKVLESAVANAKDVGNIEKEDLEIKELRVDQGPSYKYFKPGGRGMASPQKRRTSHISIVLVNKNSLQRG